MAEATLSSKNQVVIPREARKALGLKAGDKVLFTVMGDRIIMIQKPKSFAAALRGLGRGLYPPGYLEKERESWD
jgi:AbrB family looped-hinge helix DNA binding protein